MKYIKYLLFALICLFSFNIVFAANEITVDSMIPVYDENSGVIVTEENGEHSVIFNDKDQSVKYNVVLKNNTNKDIPIDNLTLPTPTEDFLKYELTGLNSGDVIKANSTKDVVILLETIKTEGWGRNFDIELTAAVNLDSSVLNPNTNDFVVILFILSIVFGCSVFVLKNKKVARYGILIIGFFSVVPYINADKQYIVPIKINVSFESQNVMKSNSCEYYGEYQESWNCDDFWAYNLYIQNFYFENEFTEIQDYAYRFDVSEDQNEKVIAYLIENKDDAEKFDLHIQADGIIYANKDASFYFADFYNIKEIGNIQGFDTSLVTDMSYMFFNTGSSNSEISLDLSNFETSNVTNMSCMFFNFGNPNSEFILNLDSFDTSNVTDMSRMFYNIRVKDLDISSLNTSNVINMSGMFNHYGYNVENLVLDLSNFDTSRVTDMSYMFFNVGYNSVNLTLDLSSFDTSSVTDMSWMFSQMGSNVPNLSIDLSSFDTSNVTDMSRMFSSAGQYSTNLILDLSSFDTSNVISMSNMFSYVGRNSTNFVLDVSNFDTSKVEYMNWMFNSTGQYASDFKLDVSNFDTSNVIDMGYMFNGTGYSSPDFVLDISNFDTGNVKNMTGMFYNTGYNSLVFTLDVSNFNTSNVETMDAMFHNAGYNSKIFNIDTSNFDMTKVKEASSMFNGAGYNSTKLITSITINKNNFANTYDYSNMFKNVAIKPGTGITVNYTSATNSLVTKMISTKTAGANVVKGVQVD